MTRFIEAIDRLFEELVHDAWRGPGSVQRARPPAPDAILELRLPVPGARCSNVALASEGQRLTITGRHDVAADATGSASATDAQETFGQSITLPAGTQPAAIEVRFDPDALHVRIRLRAKSPD